MTFLWSRKFLPKVFGGVFGIYVLSGTVFAESEAEKQAIEHVKVALLEATGVNTKLKETQREIERNLSVYAKQYQVENELATMLFVVQTTRNKSIQFKYKDTTYMVCPHYFEVKIPF